MTFTRQHYKAIAKILGENKASYEMIDAFCRFFQEDNSKFVQDKFLQAIEEAKEGG